MRLFFAFAAVCLMAAPAVAETAMSEAHHVPGHEQHTYRFGATYEVSSAQSATACQAQCDGANKCKSWSYLRPVRTSPAYCELKRGVGNAEMNPGATSGVSVKNSSYVNASARSMTPMRSTTTLRGGPSSSSGTYTPRSTTTRTYSRPTSASPTYTRPTTSQPTYTRPSSAPTMRPTTRSTTTTTTRTVTQPSPRPASTTTTTTRSAPYTTTTSPRVTRTTTTNNTTRVTSRPGPTRTVKVNQLPRTTTQTAPTNSYYPKQQEEISRIVTGPAEYYKKEDGKPRYSVQDPKKMIEDSEASVKKPTS